MRLTEPATGEIGQQESKSEQPVPPTAAAEPAAKFQPSIGIEDFLSSSQASSSTNADNVSLLDLSLNQQVKQTLMFAATTSSLRKESETDKNSNLVLCTSGV